MRRIHYEPQIPVFMRTEPQPARSKAAMPASNAGQVYGRIQGQRDSLMRAALDMLGAHQRGHALPWAELSDAVREAKQGDA